MGWNQKELEMKDVVTEKYSKKLMGVASDWTQQKNQKIEDSEDKLYRILVHRGKKKKKKI